MRNFLTLFQKELTESMRNGKWIWLPIAIILIGISQPITTYYMPQILESAGNLPEGAVIEIPTPSGEEVLASTLGQFGSIGTLLFVLGSMSAISMERQNSSLTLVMVRPVSPFQYIASKWASQLLIALVSFIASYVLVWYYTNLLFTSVDWKFMLSSLGIYSLWILFIISVTTLAGTLLKASSGIAGISIALLGVLSVSSGLFTRFMEWSPTNLRTHASGVLMNGELLENGMLVILTTVGLSLIFVWFATLNFKRFEQF
ncbi:ABC-2 type transport system permease protein [Bacillus tianshenii]|uniref:ABC-2 type transport system permease protein n=1 Tax=Sutcliffiella tianshenii TaxID=1463404 RepID=A0ABS2P5V3_9BACI|nr:ABC transporter permease subunit [Bacillus tianshenii]MBM7622007.1 ABC-2 type transport system permease protein [Bacillus tianshenii]